jgi:hypothetical protein
MEAERTGRQAAEVLENITAVDAAMQQLQRSVLHVVRSSMGDVERRRYRRRPCLVEATLSCDGQSATAAINDISERGCYARVTLPCRVGQQLTVALHRVGNPLQGVAVAVAKDGLHVAFIGNGLSAAEADRLSLTTVQELVTAGKDDQATLVRRVVDAAASRGTSQVTGLVGEHGGRFDAWYDIVNDPATLALPSFNAIAEPLHAARDCMRETLAAMAEGNNQVAQRCAAELRQHAEQLARCLDQFARDFPATFTQQSEHSPPEAAA